MGRPRVCFSQGQTFQSLQSGEEQREHRHPCCLLFAVWIDSQLMRHVALFFSGWHILTLVIQFWPFLCPASFSEIHQLERYVSPWKEEGVGPSFGHTCGCPGQSHARGARRNSRHIHVLSLRFLFPCCVPVTIVSQAQVTLTPSPAVPMKEVCGA